MRVLVVNAGSSSLKLALLDNDDETLASADLPAPQSQIDPETLRELVEGELAGADAVAHRIVHGGSRFGAPVRMDDRVRAQLEELIELAPLHQPKSLAALDAVSRALPATPAVACFDTAFHSTIPPPAQTYALPRAWNTRWGLRRYGFHGLSHAWVARRTPELLGLPADEVRIVSCHLGAGASLCAVGGGRSVDTTMGFTPLEGLVMATRSGSVDPGLLLWVQEHGDVSEREVAYALEHESGLLGLAGTADMREVLNRAETGDVDARLALDVYLHRLRSGIAAMAASLGGLDALVFTGGVGERSAAIREWGAAGLGFLGVQVDARANRDAVCDGEISPPGSRVRVAVLQAREDLEMADQARALLAERR